MRAVFEALAWNSLRGGFLILAVLLLRLLLRRTPRRVICLLWGMAALRLLLPIRLTAFFGLLPGQRARAMILIPTQSAVPVPHAAASAAGASSFDWLSVLPWLWLVGVAGFLLWTLLRVKRLRRRLSDAVLSENDAWRSDRISTPFAFGLLRPRIYLPAGLPEEDLPWVLAHERVHIRRGDTCKKALGLLLLAVYWFQPLCWLGWRAFCRDLELACDERATEGLTLTERKTYALALLRCSAPVSVIGAAGFGEKPIRVRIRTILRRRSQPRWVSILLGTVCVLLLICLCFEAPAAAQSPAPGETAAALPLPTEPAEHVASETIQERAALWTGENGSFAVSLRDGLPAALHEETNIRWEASGPMITADGSEAECHSVVVSNDPDLQLQIIPIRSGDGQDEVTLQMSGDIFGKLNKEETTEELSAPTGCTVSYQDDEGRKIRWEIQTTP